MPRTNPNQLAFSFPEPVLWAGASPIAIDLVPQRSLADRLIAAGVVRNDYEATRGCLTVPAEHRQGDPWSLPSRAYIYGIGIADHYDGPESRRSQRLVVWQESLLEHPYVAVLQKLGFEVTVDMFRATNSSWHHAIDLMTNRHWEDLLMTRRHTSPEYIANAVRFALHHTDFSVGNARNVMIEMRWPEPEGRSVEALQGYGLQPAKIPEGIAINPMSLDETGAWMMIHGVEDRWFQRGRHGHLWMSPEGMKRRETASR